jgi:hypothetical protein
MNLGRRTSSRFPAKPATRAHPPFLLAMVIKAANGSDMMASRKGDELKAHSSA